MNNACKAAVLLFQVSFLTFSACSKGDPVANPSDHAEEPEAIARTEFTDHLENFFEYEPFGAGNPSQFRIHLTNLSDGSPLEQAEVTLSVRRKGETESLVQTLAKVGKVTGIYVAELSIPEAGEYDIEFHIRNAKVNERQLLSDFKVE